MTRNLRIITTTLWALVVVAMVAVLASWTTSRLAASRSTPGISVIKVDDDGQLPEILVPPFSLTDQDGRTVTLDDLKGKIWVADFFFTTCQGPCPLMSQRMSLLHKKLTDPRIQFVSFSIDPATDTPPVLKEYAAKYGADARWHFLTGGDNATFDIARGLKLPAVPAEGTNPIFHSEKFVLVDAAGKVAGYYSHGEPESLDKLAADAQRLAGELPK